jgi:uncharacterized protein
MQYVDNTLVFSPTDLTTYLKSPFASWNDRLALEDPAHKAKKDKGDEFVSLLATKGQAHEDRYTQFLRDQGRHVVEIEDKYSDQARDETMQALQSGADAVAQAKLSLSSFAGFADFLIKVPGESDLGDYRYEIWDTKLSRTPKPEYVIQLACYAEMLDAIQGVLPEVIAIVGGDHKKTAFRTQDVFAFYQQLKQEFLEAQNNFDPDKAPDPFDSRDWGQWSQSAEELLVERNHLIQIAHITRNQIKKLHQSGIETLTELANTSKASVPGLPEAQLTKLKHQALLQGQSASKDVPLVKSFQEVGLEGDGLTRLPPASKNDVFFDLEGYPLQEGGLEYIWGNTFANEEGELEFKDFWAHNADQEKQAFCDFIDWVTERHQQDPSMHIYHYGHYETSALKRLMGRYGVKEGELDHLLRQEVFVDLYQVIKNALLVGEPRYSIKNIEHLYRTQRETDVASGGESVVVYDAWREAHAAGEEGDSWQTSAALKHIRDYNKDDCDSTKELADWLWAFQETQGIVFKPKEKKAPEVKDESAVYEVLELKDRLLADAEKCRSKEPDLSKLLINCAGFLEFHRREDKTAWWNLFRWLDMNDDERWEDPDCLIGCVRAEQEPYKSDPDNPRLKKRCYEYLFDSEQDTKKLEKKYRLLGEVDEDGKTPTATVYHKGSDLENGLITLESKHELPSTVTLAPNLLINPKPIPEAIREVVERIHTDPNKPTAILDFLWRRAPRIKGHKGPIVTQSGLEERNAEIIRAVKNLDHSYLTIQGPPGSGKTTLGARIIAELLRDGKNVGITSNSHKAYSHLMKAVVKLCHQERIEAYFMASAKDDAELEALGVEKVDNPKMADKMQSPALVGTTAWGFSRADLASRFDVLIVDEAGQVSVANLMGMSRSAKNLVFLGDQMQLGQPTQGTHPDESGASILDYLLPDDPTIEPDMGVFLGTTFRMHSKVNRFISEHIYDGKLQANAMTDQRVLVWPDNSQARHQPDAGIIMLPVVHEGNTQASEEEVSVIQAFVQELLKAEIYDDRLKKQRPITLADMLFVAPYNQQVTRLKAALGPEARVGSVDLFQGQEAPVVFFSLCASHADDSPRGMDFLFDRKRLNVALSRAQTLSVVVGNPELAKVTPRSIPHIQKANLIAALVSETQLG